MNECEAFDVVLPALSVSTAHTHTHSVRIWFYLHHYLVLAFVARCIEARVVDDGLLEQQHHWKGMKSSCSLRFAPNSHIVFVGEKTGKIRVYESIEADENDYEIAYDFSQHTLSWWDRGFLGLTVHPNFPVDPYLFVLYSINSEVNDARMSPIPNALWPLRNECQVKRPEPDNREVCHSAGRFDRLRYDVTSKRASLDAILLSDWCAYSGSHHVNHLEWARDGSLYLSAGDGSLFNGVDHGDISDGCFDIGAQTAQGAFRSQHENFLHGKILNIFNKALMSKTPLTRIHDYRIVAKGFRNPYRFTVHPHTGDLWVTDVGSEFFEEINVVRDPLRNKLKTIPNYGWPCVEGLQLSPSERENSFCTSRLRKKEFIAPFHFYNRHHMAVSEKFNHLCSSTSASATGSLFYTGKSLSEKFQNHLFFVDAAKRCVFYFENKISERDKANTQNEFVPDSTKMHVMVYTDEKTMPAIDVSMRPGQFVDIVQGPRDGFIYLVDIMEGNVDRIRPIVAKTSRLEVTLVASNPDPSGLVKLQATVNDEFRKRYLTYYFDVDGDGKVDYRSALATIKHKYTHNGIHRAVVTVESDEHRAKAEVIVRIGIKGSGGRLQVSLRPYDRSWSAGDVVGFRAQVFHVNASHLPIRKIEWKAFLQHCTPSRCSTNSSNVDCHVHPLELAKSNEVSGSVRAVQHEMPSFLSFTADVTTSVGTVFSSTVHTKPAIFRVHLTTSPRGLAIGVCKTTPCVQDVMQKSSLHLDAKKVQRLHGKFYLFHHWNVDVNTDVSTKLWIRVLPSQDMNVNAVYKYVVPKTSTEILPIPTRVGVKVNAGELVIRWSLNELSVLTSAAHMLRIDCTRSDGVVFGIVASINGPNQASVLIPLRAATYTVKVATISSAKGQGDWSESISVKSINAEVSEMKMCRQDYEDEVARNRYLKT